MAACVENYKERNNTMTTKVKFISGMYEDEVAEQVNDFISGREGKIHDIQFRMTGDCQVHAIYAAMIIYKE